MRHIKFETVASYATKSDTHHISIHGDYLTLWGRNREGWMVVHPAGTTLNIDTVYLCKRCRDSYLK